MNPADDTAWGFTCHHFARALHRVRADWRAFAICVAVSFVPTITADLTLDEMEALRVSSLMGVVELYLALVLTFRVLVAEGAAPHDHDRRRPTGGRYPAALLLNLLTLLGVVAGLVLLIVPGVLLFLLWSVTLPALAAERLGVIDAMKRSWTLTRPALANVGALSFVFFAVVAVLALTIFSIAYNMPKVEALSLVVTDLGFSLTRMFSPIAWTYAYLTLRREPA